jgi:hypothetical protein
MGAGGPPASEGGFGAPEAGWVVAGGTAPTLTAKTTISAEPSRAPTTAGKNAFVDFRRLCLVLGGSIGGSPAGPTWFYYKLASSTLDRAALSYEGEGILP